MSLVTWWNDLNTEHQALWAAVFVALLGWLTTLWFYWNDKRKERKKQNSYRQAISRLQAIALIPPLQEVNESLVTMGSFLKVSNPKDFMAIAVPSEVPGLDQIEMAAKDLMVFSNDVADDIVRFLAFGRRLNAKLKVDSLSKAAIQGVSAKDPLVLDNNVDNLLQVCIRLQAAMSNIAFSVQ